MLALDITDLKKIYPNGVEALKGVSLQVRQGEFVGLLGPNGAGKTTLISILNSLVIKSSGKVRVFGHDIDNAFGKAKACIGTVPQEFNFSIFEKVIDIVINQAGFFGLSHQVSRQRAEKYLKLLDLWDKRDHISRSLSGGMKRRLMIARAMVHEPKILILDEPTAGVDIALRRSMWQFLKEINQSNITIILTTHYLEEAEHLCERIAIIDHGKLIEDMNKRQLISQLKTESFLFDLKSPFNTALLQDSVLVDNQDIVFTQVDDDTCQVDLSKHASLNDVFALLERYNIITSSMRNKANRLEELFLAYTQKQQEGE